MYVYLYPHQYPDARHHIDTTKTFLIVIYMYFKRLFYMYMLIEIFLCNFFVVIVLQNIPQLGGWVVMAIFKFAAEMM